jgi:hypothetical protein
MKYYVSYCDRQEISPEMHAKLLALGEEKEGQPQTGKPRKRWKPLAALVALAACCVIIPAVGLPIHTSNTVAPSLSDRSDQSEFQISADSSEVLDSTEQGAADFHGFVVEGSGETRGFPFVPYISYPDVGTDLAMSSASLALPEGALLVDLTQEEIETIFWGGEGKPETETGDLPWTLFWDGYTVHSSAIYDGAGQLYLLSLYGERTDADANFELTLSPGQLPPDCLLPSAWESSEVLGTEVTGWCQTYDRDGDGAVEAVCSSQFMAGTVGVRFQNVNAPFQMDEGDGWNDLSAAKDFNALFVRQALSDDGGLYLEHLLTAETVPDWREESFDTLAQARQETEFAPYLPETDIPGYRDFYGRLSYQEGGENLLFVRWSLGYDDVWVEVYRENPPDFTLADLSTPASYDRRLYDTPWSDTVPEEFRETISMCVFRAEDMTLDLVKARGTEKDTGGTSYTFGVLHPDGTLVVYYCDGISAEQVWAMVENTLPKT